MTLTLPQAGTHLLLDARRNRDTLFGNPRAEPHFWPVMEEGGSSAVLNPTSEVPSGTLFQQLVLPLLAPALVGVNLSWQKSVGSEAIETCYDLGQHFFGGVWTSQQAWGTFRPAHAGTVHDQQVFPSWLLPGQKLVGLSSPNGKHWLQVDGYPAASRPILYYYLDGQRGGCVFEHHSFNGSDGLASVVLGTDGNLTLTVKNSHQQEHVVAQTALRDVANSVLHLTDEGQLQLLAPRGQVRHTFRPYSLRLDWDGKTNLWVAATPPTRISQGKELHSPNGQYCVRFELDYKPSGSDGGDTLQIDCQLVRYRLEPGQPPQKIDRLNSGTRMYYPVKHIPNSERGTHLEAV